MSRVRTWMVSVALACFGAGTAVGLVLPRLVGPATPPESRLEREVRRFARDFELSPKQVRLLRSILRDKYREKEKIVSWAPEHWDPVLRTQLEQANRKADQLIHALLNPRQREKFRRDSGAEEK